MNTFSKTLVIFAVIPFWFSACRGQATQEAPANNDAAIIYQVVLGKSMQNKDVTDFIARNSSIPAGQFQLCEEIGMALWTDADQIVKTVHLYSGNIDGIRRYRGKLPFGLSFYDPMWRVQEKLMDLDSANPLHQAGLPEEAGSPDHMHYWAVYKRLGMTVIYNSPGKDEDAYIYAILMSK